MQLDMSSVVGFVKSLYEGGFTAFFDWLANFASYLTPVSPDINLTAFLGATLDMLFPFPVLLAVVSAELPLLALNFLIALVLRVKSFIPTMGGK